MRIYDEFNGDNEHLRQSISALIELNAIGATTPRVPNMAIALLSAAYVRLEKRTPWWARYLPQ